MSLASDLRNLQQQRDRELTLLRTRFTTITEALDASPAQWVREHPYIALVSASTVGFIAAQLPPHRSSSPGPPTPVLPSPPPPASSPIAPPTPTSIYAHLLALLIPLVEQLLQPAPESSPPPPASPASLTIADAGSVAGSTFPGFLRPTDECAPMNPP